MFNHRLMRRGRLVSLTCLISTFALSAPAGTISGMSQIGGWVYIDRNNDGHLAFLGEPNPEYVLGDVTIRLFSKANNIETFIASTITDAYGRFLFQNVVPGTYVLKETQPAEYVDGKDTVGLFQGLNGNSPPANPSLGVAGNDQISDIVLLANVWADYYCFGERGLKAGYVSKRQLLLTSVPGLNTGVPEPTAILLTLLGSCGVWYVRRSRR